MTIMPVVSPFITEPDNRFILDEAKFMFDLGYVPPAARPENFAKFSRLLDELCEETACATK